MKKILFAIALVFSIGSVVAQQKIGHVDSKVLLDTLPSYKMAESNLKQFEKAGYEELMEMQADLERAYAAYEQKRGDLTPVVDKIEQDKLNRKQQILQQRNQDLEREMQEYSQSLYQPLMGRIEKAINIVADSKKLAYVLDKSNALYVKGGLDITNEVIVELLKIDAAETQK